MELSHKWRGSEVAVAGGFIPRPPFILCILGSRVLCMLREIVLPQLVFDVLLVRIIFE